MQVSFVSYPSGQAAERGYPRQTSTPLRFASNVGRAGVRPDEEWQSHYRHAVAALGDARARAERAEQRLRSRLAEVAWPAALGGIAAGLMAVLALRLAGL